MDPESQIESEEESEWTKLTKRLEALELSLQTAHQQIAELLENPAIPQTLITELQEQVNQMHNQIQEIQNETIPPTPEEPSTESASLEPETPIVAPETPVNPETTEHAPMEPLAPNPVESPVVVPEVPELQAPVPASPTESPRKVRMV